MTLRVRMLVGLVAVLSLAAGGVAAQVKSANPAKTWIYQPNVTVMDLWRDVQTGRIDVISTAAASGPSGSLNLITVFRGDGKLWRCVERVDPQMVEITFACSRNR